jgi:hypothetical protein
MKQGIMFFLAIFLLSGVGRTFAKEMSPITVKKSEVTNGVLVVSALKANKPFQLQCNDGAAGCTPLKSGKYQMVELPGNTGMYDCKDVEVYPESTANPGADADKKLGEYCLSTD